MESKETRERRVRRTGRRGERRNKLRTAALVLLFPVLALLIGIFDYQGGISVWEGTCMALVVLLVAVYIMLGIRRQPVRGWAKIEQERREVQRIRKRRSQR